jgi:hypothetical protein
MKFNYGKLLPGMIVGTTDTLSAFGILTRSTEAGIKNAMNSNIASHIALIVKEHDLLYVVEMALPKIRQGDLNEYEHSNLGDHAVFVANPFGFDYQTNYDLQDKVNKWILKCHTIGIKYNLEELFRFWDIPLHDSTKKLICSELARNMMETFKLPVPKEWDNLCNPYDIQKYVTENKMLVEGWKK